VIFLNARERGSSFSSIAPDLHTEIAKVAKTDSELDDPMISNCPLPS
jgi:hypothetical protein